MRGGKREGAGRKNGVGGDNLNEEPRKGRSFRATDAEWNAIVNNAKLYKMSVGSYIRKKCIDDEKK